MKRVIPWLLLIVFTLMLTFSGCRSAIPSSAPSEDESLLGTAPEDDNQLDSTPEYDNQVDLTPENDNRVDSTPEDDNRVDSTPEDDNQVDSKPKGGNRVDSKPKGGNRVDSTPAKDKKSTEKVKKKIEIPVAGYVSTPQSDDLLQGNAPMTYVGLGYNVLDRAYIVPDGFSRGRPIFDPDKVKQLLKTDIPPVNPNSMIIGNSVSEYSNIMKSKLSLSANYPMFSGNLSAEYDMSKTNKKNTYFIKSMSGYIKESQYILVTKDLNTILDKTFEEDLNSAMSPEELFAMYGTHVLVEALMGARCTYNYTYSAESSEDYTSIQGKIDAAYKYVSGKFSSEEKETAEAFLYKCTFHSELSGGPNIDSSTFDKLLTNFPTWVAGLKDSVPTVYGISNSNSLIPIWNYAKDEKRAKELKDYFYQRGGDIQKLLDNMSKIPEEPSTKTYIEDIIITSDKKDKVARDGSDYSGYTIIDKDLNEEAGGEYIYLWYKTTTDKDKALRDIRFTYDDFADIPNFYKKNDHDLNAGAGGRYIYIWTTKQSSIGEPITDIKVLFGKNADMPSGYEPAMVNYYKKGKNTREKVELNYGAGGYYIYLGYSNK